MIHWVYRNIAYLLLVLIGWYALDRVMFMYKAQHITGNVISVDAKQDMCGGYFSSRSLTYYPPYKCTRYTAHLKYVPTTDKSYVLSIPACTRAEKDDPAEGSSCFPVGTLIPVIYNPQDPSEAYVDDIVDLWGPHW